MIRQIEKHKWSVTHKNREYVIYPTLTPTYDVGQNVWRWDIWKAGYDKLPKSAPLLSWFKREDVPIILQLLDEGLYPDDVRKYLTL